MEKYQKNDYFYDIESLNEYNNLFTTVFLAPFVKNNHQKLVLSYLSTSDQPCIVNKTTNQIQTVYDALQSSQLQNLFYQKVHEFYSTINRKEQNIQYDIEYEDLTKLGYVPTLEEQNLGFPVVNGLQTFIQRLGLPRNPRTNADYLDLPTSIIYECEKRHFYSNMIQDKEKNNDLQGYLFSYNGHSYDETMLALIINEIVETAKASSINGHFLTEKIVDIILTNIPTLQTNKNNLVAYVKNYVEAQSIFINIIDLLNGLRQNVPFTDDVYQNIYYQIANIRLSNIISEKDIRHEYNDTLFDSEYKNNMSRFLDIDAFTKRYQNPYQSPTNPRKIYSHWKRSGRYIDVMVMAERDGKEGLKRTLGTLGFRIKESENLSGNNDQNATKTLEELVDDLIYNTNDVIGLRVFFEEEDIYNKFKVKRDLLTEYPYIVYEDDAHTKIKMVPATADFTSAKMIERILVKDNKPLVDIPVIDYTYPSPHAINYIKSIPEYAHMDIQPTDILEVTLEWFIQNVCKHDATHLPKKQAPRYNFILKKFVYDYDIEQIDKLIQNNCTQDQYHAFLDFKQVYQYFDYFRGKNVNASERYAESMHQTYLNKEHLRQTPDAITYATSMLVNDLQNQAFAPLTATDIIENTKNYQTSIFYFDNNAKRTSCMATLSRGGIHGQEINLDYYNNVQGKHLYMKELAKKYRKEFKTAKNLYEHLQENADAENIDHLNQVVSTDILRQLINVTVNDKNETVVKWQAMRAPNLKLFKLRTDKKKGTAKFELNDEFKFVSVGQANHEDFTSYYPMLICCLAIFKPYKDYDPNAPLTEDTTVDEYLEIFKSRKKLKDLASQKDISDEERSLYKSLQLTKKLLLNAGSGAADRQQDTLIRKNNAINSMRIIGQLFAYTIGQAQALAGARVPSTNTDGLYTMDITPELNNQILVDVSQSMYIGIEPEIVDTFISKDTNNRVEIHGTKISEAKGGQLTSHAKPDILKSLDHPAIIDRMLVMYLSQKPNAVTQDFDRDFARKFFNELYVEYENNPKKGKAELLRMFQWILASSPHSENYIYEQHTDGLFSEDVALQRYNRMFLIKRDASIFSTYRSARRQSIVKSAIKKELKDLLEKPAEERSDEDIEQIKELFPHSHPTAYYLMSEKYHNNMSEYTLPTYSRDFYKRVTMDQLPKYKANIQKIKNLKENQAAMIINDNIMALDDQTIMNIFAKIDVDAYLDILETTFSKSWRNNYIEEEIMQKI